MWCNSIVKFYLEMSASPSGCVLAVIVLSISTAPACLLPLPLVKPWQRAWGEERWGEAGWGKEKGYLHRSVRLSSLTFVCLYSDFSWKLTSCLFVLSPFHLLSQFLYRVLFCFGSAGFTSFSTFSFYRNCALLSCYFFSVYVFSFLLIFGVAKLCYQTFSSS